MTNEEIWQLAEREGGLRLNYGEKRLATAARHQLYRWRKRWGGYSEFSIVLDETSLVIKREFTPEITTLSGAPVEEESLAEQAKKDDIAAAVLRLKERHGTQNPETGDGSSE